MGWVKTPQSSGEPPSGKSFLVAVLFLLFLVVCFVAYLHATGKS